MIDGPGVVGSRGRERRLGVRLTGGTQLSAARRGRTRVGRQKCLRARAHAVRGEGIEHATSGLWASGGNQLGWARDGEGRGNVKVSGSENIHANNFIRCTSSAFKKKILVLKI